jgi:hypothetical protein
LLAGSCTRIPDSYPTPVQYGTTPPPDAPLLTLGFPNSHARILQDVHEDPTTKGGLWTGQHPAFSFTLKRTDNLDFYMRFSVHSTTFKDTGPVTITIHVNDEVIDRVRIDAPGEREYSHPVPAKSPVIVHLDVDPVWMYDGTTMGVILWSIGFEERAP